MFDTVACGTQIVQNNNLFHLQLVDKIFGIHNPRKICSANAIFNYRSGDTKTGSFDALARQGRRGLPQKFLHDEGKLRKFLAGKSLFENKSEVAVCFREQREITLRTADIPSKDHQLPLNRREILLGILRRVVPVPAVTLEKNVGLMRAPASGRILRDAGAFCRGPDIEDWIDPRPGGP